MIIYIYKKENEYRFLTETHNHIEHEKVEDDGFKLIDTVYSFDFLAKNYEAINEIENAMEQWHHARDNDKETLEKINEILVNANRLEWFNKEKK
jgi:hypothetical protein